MLSYYPYKTSPSVSWRTSAIARIFRSQVSQNLDGRERTNDTMSSTNGGYSLKY